MGWRRWLPLGLILLVGACVSTPTSKELAYQARGLPLVTSGTVVAFLSAKVPSETHQASGSELELLMRAFEDGFHKVRPDAKIQWADETLLQACVARSTEYPSTFVTPDSSGAKCQELINRWGVRYVISIDGVHASYTAHQGGQLFAGGWAYDEDGIHTFGVSAFVFDEVARGKGVCKVSVQRSGNSMTTVLGLFYVIPIPMMRLVDEGAFWRSVAHEAGYGIGGCFVPPDAEKPSGSGIRN